LIAPVERPHQLPRPTLAITKAKPFLDQDANRFDGPSAARLSAWHRFLLKQLTELVQFLRLQVTLAMLPSPARIILQAVQASLLVGLRPATDRLFIHKEDVGGLPITIAFGHEQQRMVALPLMSIEFLVFVPSRSFQEVWLAQHCASFFRKRCSTRRLYSVSAGSISWCAGHIVPWIAGQALGENIVTPNQEQTLKTVVDLLVHKRRDYRDLFTSNETFINRPLASVYRVPFASTSDWAPYTFSESSERSGILTQISFLSLFAPPGSSSPIKRGIKVLEIFMGEPTPDPPANVDFSKVQDSSKGTIRGRLLDICFEVAQPVLPIKRGLTRGK